jgi:hypothetical protein
MDNVVLLTTMWDKARDKEEAEKWEADQKQRFRTVGRLLHANNPKSLWVVVDEMIRRHQLGPVLPLLERMEEKEALVRNLEGVLREHNEDLISLQGQVNRGRADADAEMVTLRKEMADLREEVAGLRAEMAGLVTVVKGTK